MYVYTAGYMTGSLSDRFNWRKVLEDVMKLKDSPIKFLHPQVEAGVIPGQGDNNIYGLNDILLIQKCDLVVAYFDLKVARCLGASLEMGYAHALQKPIIMIDKSPDIGSLDLNRFIASSIHHKISSAAKHLDFISLAWL